MAGITATYVSEVSFTVVGDLTADFNTGRRIRATCSTTFKYGTVVRSTYSSPNTTVTITNSSDALNSDLTTVFYGIQSDSVGSIATHKHDATEGEGGIHRHDDRYQPGLPKDLLIYYAHPSNFNYPTNFYVLENVARDMAQYNMIIFGDGVANTGHGDYSNFTTIIARLKVLKPTIKLFGYVTAFQSQANFETKVDELSALSEIDGIFMDECGYDFTVSRLEFNAEVVYVHASDCPICFVNAWNMNHIIGVTNDASYPNGTWNPGLVASELISDDWFLLESYPINTTAYSANNGYGPMYDWLSRGQTAIGNREEFGINLANISTIDNDDADNETLFLFHYLTALAFCLDGQGSSHNSYASSVPIVSLYKRTNYEHMGLTYEIEPSVSVAGDNWEIHYRYTNKGKIICDHTREDPIITFSRTIESNYDIFTGHINHIICNNGAVIVHNGNIVINL